MLRSAAPQSTGTNLPCTVPLRMSDRTSSASREPAKYLSMAESSSSAAASQTVSLASARASAMAGGTGLREMEEPWLASSK